MRSLLLSLAVVAPIQVQALVPLGQEPHVWNSLLSAMIGDQIRIHCPTISARMFTVLRKAAALERYALDLGYSREEIDAFLNNEEEMARMRREAGLYLAEHGVRNGDPESYCRLGREEIARGSLIGELLYEH